MSQKKNEGILFSAEIRVVGSYTDRLLNRGDSLDIDNLLSLFNVNFIEYQMKCFSFLIEYLKQKDLSDVYNFFN